jgi:hypothetical protein
VSSFLLRAGVFSFFFGAGTSIAVGLDGLTTITKKVAEMLNEELKPCYQNLLEETGINGNVEDVLNRVRVYRELLGDDALQSFNGISGKTAKTLSEHSASEGLPALVNIDNMVLRHCAIVGSTGSGVMPCVLSNVFSKRVLKYGWGAIVVFR